MFVKSDDDNDDDDDDDDNDEKCSRKNCLGIHGVEVKEHENESDVMNTLKEYYSCGNVVFDANDIDCACNIGLPYTEKKIQVKNGSL